jgi:acetyl esterase/lipase
VVVELADEEGYLAAPVNRGELYSVDATGRGGRLVFGYRVGPPETSHIRRGEPDLAWGHVIDTLHHDGRHVLVEARSMREVGDRVVRLYKLDAYSGVKTFVTQSPAPETEFFADENGEPRVAYGFDKNVKMRFYHRDGTAGWRELGNMKGFTAASLPVGFVARDRTIRIVEPLEGGFGLLSVAIDSGERRLLARTDLVPPRTIIEDHANRNLIAVEREPDLPGYEFVDPDHPVSRALQHLQASHPDEYVRLVARTEDDRQAVVLVFSDRDPGRYLVLDVESRAARPIAEVRPWIDPRAMSRTTPLHLAASDGFRIHGYLTSPREPRLGVPPPLVVFLHGGPHSVRDTWGFDPEVQLLATAGYAVLQVNFRGSGGYGLAYQEAGYRKWGDRVVQDVVDATRHATGAGLADPRRICTYGGSFGAYAALQAAVLAPDLYRCAVGDAGIYDLTRVAGIADIAESSLASGFISTAVGNDPAMLRRASPTHNVDRIRARVFLVHGKRDRRAPIEQAEGLRQALEARGEPVEWLVEPNEGHGFYDEGARERMFARLLAFLERSIGAERPEPARPSSP